MESWLEMDNLKTDSLRFRITLKLLDLVEEGCNDGSNDRGWISQWINKIKFNILDTSLYNDLNAVCKEVNHMDLREYLSNEEHCYFELIRDKLKIKEEEEKKIREKQNEEKRIMRCELGNKIKVDFHKWYYSLPISVIHSESSTFQKVNTLLEFYSKIE